MELSLWGETEEFRQFVAGYIRTLPVKGPPNAIDRRFLACVLELTDGVTGKFVDLLRRAAICAATPHSQRIGLEVLQHLGAQLPTIICHRAQHAPRTGSTTLFRGIDDKLKRNPQRL